MQTVYLLVVCLYVFNLAATSVKSTTTSPSPAMSCSSDGTITYTGIPGWVNSVYSTHGKATLNPGSPRSIVITGCHIGTSTTVTMYSMSTTPASMNAVMKVAGSNVNTIILTCKRSTNNTFKVAAMFPGRVTVAPTSLTAMETISLTMSLKDHDKTTIPPHVVIGGAYDLHITGAGVHYMKITTCSAGVDSDMNDAVAVYDTGNNTLGIINSPTTVVGPGTDLHSLKATLTGFRLVKSPVVVLQCTVKVCDDVCTTRKRMRTKYNLKSASLTFQVMGTQSVRSANGVRDMHSAGKITVATAMALVARNLVSR